MANQFVASGNITVKNEVKKIKFWGGEAFVGFWLTTYDEDSKYETGMVVKTTNASVAEQLKAVANNKEAKVNVVGTIRTENIAKKVEGEEVPANWVTFLYVDAVSKA